MTLQQEAHRKVDQLSDDGLRTLMDLIDKFEIVSTSEFEEASRDDKAVWTEQSGGENKSKDVDLFPVKPVVTFPEEDADSKRIRAEKKEIYGIGRTN